MPILHVRALPQKDKSRIVPALKKTVLAISEAYGCSPKHVWATWEDIKADHYIEGEKGALIQPEATHPPICELVCFEGKGPEEIESILTVAATTLSEGLGIGNNIFMTYSEAKSGEVIAGDGIVRKK